MFLVDYDLQDGSGNVVASLQILNTARQCQGKEQVDKNYRISLLRRAVSKIQTQHPNLSANAIVRTKFTKFTREDYADFDCHPPMPSEEEDSSDVSNNSCSAQGKEIAHEYAVLKKLIAVQKEQQEKQERSQE